MRITGILAGYPDTSLRSIDVYRIAGPFAMIKDRTKHVAQWLYESQLHQAGRRELDAVLSSDIIVVSRLVHKNPLEAGRAMHGLRSRGAKLVYETDDDLTGLYRQDPGGATCMPYLVEVDAITTTVKPLADRLHDISDRPAYVLPNYMPLGWLSTASMYTREGEPRERQYSDTLNIMLVGTATHAEDWRVIIDLIPAILQDYPNVRVLFAGYKPEFAPDHERIGFLPPRPYSGYPAMLFEADIVCAGLDPNDPFNWAKSPCKVLESWAAQRRLEDGKLGGAAVIASDTVVYHDTVTDGDDGLLVEHTPEAWEHALRSLIEDEHLRHSLQRRGFNTVRQHSIASHYREWLSVYNRILRS